MFKGLKSTVLKGRNAVSTAVLTGSVLVVNSANAAIDVDGVKTGIEAAEASAHSIGTVIIGVIAGLSVVGIVIGLVRKL